MIGIAVWNELAVNLVINPSLWDFIDENFGIWNEFLYLGSHYKRLMIKSDDFTLNSEVFVLGFIMTSVPVVGAAVLAAFNDKLSF